MCFKKINKKYQEYFCTACGVNNLNKRNKDGSRREKRQVRFGSISDYPDNAPPPKEPFDNVENQTASIEDLINDSVLRVSSLTAW